MIEPVAWLVYEPALPTQYLTEEEPVEVLTNSPGTTATPLYAIPPGYALVRVEQVKDAERFDFLRKQTGSIRFGDHSLCGQFEGQRGLFNEFIDAAITAAKGE